ILSGHRPRTQNMCRSAGGEMLRSTRDYQLGRTVQAQPRITVDMPNLRGLDHKRWIGDDEIEALTRHGLEPGTLPPLDAGFGSCYICRTLTRCPMELRAIDGGEVQRPATNIRFHHVRLRVGQLQGQAQRPTAATQVED